MRRRCLLIAAAAALSPAIAEAHLIVTGFGPLYDGVAHVSLSAEDVLPLVALGLFAGRRGPKPARFALAGLTGGAALGAGLEAALGLPLSPVLSPAMTAGLLLAVGAALAADLPLGAGLCAALAAVVGVLRGAADLGGVGGDGAARGLTALGAAAAAAGLFALSASLTLPLRRSWLLIAARVAGSWAAAAGLLLAGWLIRYGAQAT